MEPLVTLPTSLGVERVPVPAPTVGALGEKVWQELHYAAWDGYRPLSLDLRVPAGVDRPPLVVWVHGGSWEHGTRRMLPINLQPLFGRVLEAGMAVASLDYRLLDEAPFPAPRDDVRDALAWLVDNSEAFGYDHRRLALWGESAGGHLGLLAAYAEGSPVRAMVDFYGPTDLMSLLSFHSPGAQPGSGVTLLAASLGLDTHRPVPLSAIPANLPAGVDRSLVRRLLALEAQGWETPGSSPSGLVRPGLPPTLLVHGRDDDVVPLAQSEGLAKDLEQTGNQVELVVTDGGHVFEGPDGVAIGSEMIDRAISWIADRLAEVR